MLIIKIYHLSYFQLFGIFLSFALLFQIFPSKGLNFIILFRILTKQNLLISLEQWIKVDANFRNYIALYFHWYFIIFYGREVYINVVCYKFLILFFAILNNVRNIFDLNMACLHAHTMQERFIENKGNKGNNFFHNERSSILLNGFINIGAKAGFVFHEKQEIIVYFLLFCCIQDIFDSFGEEKLVFAELLC